MRKKMRILIPRLFWHPAFKPTHLNSSEICLSKTRTPQSVGAAPLSEVSPQALVAPEIPERCCWRQTSDLLWSWLVEEEGFQQLQSPRDGRSQESKWGQAGGARIRSQPLPVRTGGGFFGVGKGKRECFPPSWAPEPRLPGASVLCLTSCQAGEVPLVSCRNLTLVSNSLWSQNKSQPLPNPTLSPLQEGQMEESSEPICGVRAGGGGVTSWSRGGCSGGPQEDTSGTAHPAGLQAGGPNTLSWDHSCRRRRRRRRLLWCVPAAGRGSCWHNAHSSFSSSSSSFSSSSAAPGLTEKGCDDPS
ncbi:uncharacterized protein LOC127465534 [Manacus candei]|uniref:uncharacterized protein LOC127465534 n=1 Tax=Manacus candei TaxID=415023 RepID=UPI002225DCEC|nr:uncharacterized protein LOC127465534 [Manacus candei]